MIGKPTQDSVADEPGAALLAQALACHQRGDLAGAEQHCRQVLQHQPRHGEALNLLGAVLSHGGQINEGCQALEAAVAVAPEHPVYLANLAHARLLLGDLPGAEHAGRKATELQPEHFAAWMTLGQIQLRQDRVEDAEISFAAAGRCQPDSAEALEGLGFALQRQGRLADAAAAFQRCLALNPDNASALANLAGLCLEQGKPQDALAPLQQAVALSPDRPDLRVNLSVLLHSMGESNRALSEIEQVLSRDSNHTRARGLLGPLLWHAGRDDEARPWLDYDHLIRARPLEPPPGHATLEAFNATLAEAVLADPSLTPQRSGKTTRGGLQSGELFAANTGPFAELRSLVQHAMGAYFNEAMIARPETTPAPPSRARLTGWSTVLHSGGHQDPHNHPSGRLSGVYYVKLPAVIGNGAADEQGFIEFGQTSDKLGFGAGLPTRRLRPEAGAIVLFPSYFWHRTLPFESSEPRISIAFDLIPL